MRLKDLRNWVTGGGDAAPPPARASPPSGLPVPSAPAPTAPATWPRERLAFAHQLWDEGFIGPGGSEEILRRATPLGLSAASSLLLLGAGAGGPARCVATLFGAWVDGYETDPALVARANAVCAAAGLGKRVRIDLWNPAAPGFAPHSCHHALAFDPFRAVPPSRVLDSLARTLRPGGQLSLLATASAPDFDPEANEVATWSALDMRACAPPAVAAVSRALADCGFDVRVTEDLTGPHAHQIVTAWRSWVRTITAAGARPSPAQAAVIVREAELWLRRVRLLRAGGLRWVRWHAILKPG